MNRREFLKAISAGAAGLAAAPFVPVAIEGLSLWNGDTLRLTMNGTGFLDLSQLISSVEFHAHGCDGRVIGVYLDADLDGMRPRKTITLSGSCSGVETLPGSQRNR